MQKVGIDKIGFYTPKHYVELDAIAQARGLDAEKFKRAVGQEKMAVTSPDEDIVTMGANAAYHILQDVDLNTIDTLFFATESGIDQSKAAGLFILELLGLPKHIRVVEIKQACYAATAALRLSLPLLQMNPEKKVLVISSDVARYGLASAGESSQGAGAVAMLLSSNPRALVLEPESGVYSESAMDFWRPNYRDEALVDGMASSKLYLNCLEETWHAYSKASGRQYHDHAYFCFHVPVARLVEKAFKHLLKVSGQLSDYSEELMEQQTGISLHYNRESGNCYTAAMYLALCALLDREKTDLTGKRIGFYSYGSGCVAEYFSGVVQADYRKVCDSEHHQTLIANRKALTVAQYEAFYQAAPHGDQGDREFENFQPGRFRLAAIKAHKRIYE